MRPILTLKQLLDFYDSPKQAPVKAFSKWFPLLPSKKLAEIVGYLIGDGHLQGKPKWRMDFTSNNSKTLEYFDGLIFSLFKVRGKVRKCTTNKYNTYNLGINSKALARVLFLCGVPKGAKVSQDFLVPSWILSNKSYFRSFIRSYFSCEACVDKYGSIMFEQWKLLNNLESGKLFLGQIKKGLNEYFEIDLLGPYEMSYENKTLKGITKGLRMKIRKKATLSRYYKLIGFTDLIKQSNLKDLVSDY